LRTELEDLQFLQMKDVPGWSYRSEHGIALTNCPYSALNEKNRRFIVIYNNGNMME